MIGWVHDLIVSELLAPQEDEALGERRVFVDPESAPIDVEAQEFDLNDLTTVPLSYEIGGSVELRHTVEVGLDVQTGDLAESRRLRDLILTDLILRAVAKRDAIAQLVDPVSGQYVHRIGWLIDYRPLGVASNTNESATVRFLVDVILDG